jgi:multidrug efflux pump subunit AcrB
LTRGLALPPGLSSVILRFDIKQQQGNIQSIYGSIHSRGTIGERGRNMVVIVKRGNENRKGKYPREKSLIWTGRI